MVAHIENSDRLSSNSPQSFVLTVTPELAAEWLRFNENNRSLSESAVAMLARSMSEGDWRLSGEAVKFSASGRLIDGQHRLAAVVLCGVPIPMLVVTGLDDDVVNVIDTGRKRSLGDRLRMAGENQANALASAVHWHHRFVTGQYKANGWSRTTIDEALRHLQRNPGLRDAVVQAERIRKAIRGPGGVYAALIYEFMLLDEQDAQEFIDRLVSGANLEATDPILRLRELMIAHHASHLKQPDWRVMALVIKAWNYYRDGAEVKQLSYRHGGAQRESFPIPH